MLKSGAPEVTFVADGTRAVAKPGATVLEIAEANGQKIEAGCRMGVCGADPIAIKDGHGQPLPRLRRRALDARAPRPRRQHAHGVLLPRPGPGRGRARRPTRRARPTPSQILRMSFDRSIERVVVLGNGIAGVTAADHVRRRHPECQIDLVADEPHPLYNRMGINRLIYGRSAMAGLYLNPDAWYEERRIETWLNTRAARIDRDAREVELGTGERLAYDRLILALGSSAMVPRIDGFGGRGTFVVRSAEDALSIRAFAQREWCREALIAGGGLLGLEAGYALHKLGLHASILERSDRLLRRQLDARASEYLRRYLEGLGMSIVTGAETAAALGDERLSARCCCATAARCPPTCCWCARGSRPTSSSRARPGSTSAAACVVDDGMRTSDPRIFAAGDVAEHRGRVHGLWPAAVEQAEVAACGALGEEKAYRGTRAGDDPQGRRHRADLDRPLRARAGRRGGDRARGRERGPLPQARDRRRPDRRARSCSATRAEASPVVTAVKRGYDVRGLLPRPARGALGRARRAERRRTALVPAAPANPSSG